MDDFILTVKFFQASAGTEPVHDFLMDLPRADRKVIGTDIKEVQLGWPLGMPLVRKMAPGLWEVRSQLENRIARVLFTVYEGQMVLLHAFIKKSGKTPQADLELGKKRLHQIHRGMTHG